jgi:AsmA protein
MKKFVIGILILILLLVAGALAAPFVIPTDIYKAKLIAVVKESTGRDLKIDGPISFSLLPQIALSAQDVSFANAPGGIAQDMVQLKSMALKLKLLPLLSGTVEIDSLVLVEPAIALEIDKQGRPNWDFSQTETSEGAPALSSETSSKGGGLSALSSLRLGEIQLQNGEVSYADQRSEKRWDASAINVTLSMTDLDSPLAAQGSAMWNDEQVNLVIAVAKPSAFAGGNATDISVKLASNPFNLDFAGTGAGGPEMKLSGVVDLAVPSVRDLAKWAGTPITMAGSGLGPLSIKGKVEVVGDTYEFSDAEITLDAIKATGAISVDTSHDKPYAKGDLEVETLDLNPYLAPQSASPQAGAAQAAAVEGSGGGMDASTQKGWSTEPMDLSPLKLADADFDLSAQAIRFRQIAIAKSVLSIHLKDGVLATDLSDIELYQGKGQGKVTIDGTGAVPAIAESFTLTGVDVQPLLHDAANVSLLSGTGSLDMSVTGHGKSQRDIVSSLAGKGSLAIDRGALKGVDMVAMVKNAASALTAGVIGGSNQTDFSTLTATYTITNGILKNSDLKMDSPGLPMTGAGTVDLPQQRVDYKLTPKIVGALAVPVNITGPWDDLSYRPDLAGVVTQSGKSLKNILKNPSDLEQLKSLLGGKKQQ